MKTHLLSTFFVFILLYNCTAQQIFQFKGAALDERLIAYSYVSGNTSFDTIRFYYSMPATGSAINNDENLLNLNFGFSDILIPNLPKPAYSFELSPDISFDSCYRIHNGPFVYDTTESRFKRSYTSNSIVTTEARSEYGSLPRLNTSYKTTFTYNATGQKYSVIQEKNGNLTKTGYHKYDANGHKIVDSFLEVLNNIPQNSLSFEYEYNTAGNITSLTTVVWASNLPNAYKRTLWTYNQFHKPVTSLQQTGGPNWENNRKDSFSYTSIGIHNHNIHTNWEPNSNYWGQEISETYFRNSSGLIDSVLVSSNLNGLVSKSKFSYTYTR